MIPTFIVDDVQSDRYIARRRLSKTGCFGPVEEACDGADFLARFFGDAHAQETADGTIPQLILLDINMPELDGFETIEELKRQQQDRGGPLPQVVALFSSSDNERDIERSHASGVVDHFFTKPISDAAIDEILATYRAMGYAI